MAQRRLQVVLDLDTGRYTGRMTQAAGVTQKFAGVANRSSTSVRQLDRSFNNLNSSMSTPLQKLRDYVLILGNVRMAILNVRDIAVGWVGSLIQQSAQVERLTILMKGLSRAQDDVGKSAEATKNMRMLFQEARRTGFAVDALADAFVKMKSGGLDPTDGSLRALSNAVAHFGGNSDVLHRASIAIQQMAGKGVISMEELRQQLGEAVPTAMMDMASAAGMSVREFTDLVSKGAVDAEPALKLLFQRWEILYAGAGERLAATLTGQQAVFKTNLMELSTAFTGFNINDGKAVDGGLYQQAADALKEINEAMNSIEGKKFASEFGQSVAEMMQFVISAGRAIIEFKDEIIFLGKTAVSVWAAMKAAAIFQWMIGGANQARIAMIAMATGSAQSTGVMQTLTANMTRAIQAKSNALRQSIYMQNLETQSARAGYVAANQASAAAYQRVQALNVENATLRSKIATEQASIQAARQAQVVAQTNIATGVRMSQSIQQLKAAKTQETLATIRLAEAERLLTANKSALTAATAKHTAAVSTLTASIARNQAATGMATVALRAKSAVLTAATVAARGFSIAINALLGPLGIVATLILSAAYAAGVFENKASKAAAAAARLMQGIASLDDMENQLEERRRLRREIGAIDGKLSAGRGFERTNASPYSAGRAYTPAEIEKLRSEREQLVEQLDRTELALEAGEYAQAMEAGRVGAQTVSFALERRTAEARNEVKRLNDQRADQAEIDAAQERYLNLRSSLIDRQLGVLDQRLADAVRKGDTNGAAGIQEMIDKYKEQQGITDQAKIATEQLRGAINGVSDATDTSSSSTSKEAATRQRYNQMIAQSEGRIAELRAELTGANGSLAEFNARLANGMYADANADEIEKLRDVYKRLDEVTREVELDKGMRRLRLEVQKTAAELNGLWNAFDSDESGAALQRVRSAGEIRGRFQKEMDEAIASGDIANVIALNDEINKVIENTRKLEAVDVASKWREMSVSIEESFLSAEEARNAAFQRELEANDALRQMYAEGTEERRRLDEQFYRWKAAKEEELRRQNEHQVVKMARDWAELGQNIEGALAGAMNSFVEGIAEGELNFADFTKSIIKEILKIIIKAMVAYAILSALGMANGAGGQPISFREFLGGQLGAGVDIKGTKGAAKGIGNIGGPITTVPTKHIGGIIGGWSRTATVDSSVFANAKKYHTGANSIGGRALRPGEVPIIGMEGEAVLTEDHQKMIHGALRSKGGGVALPPVNVNIINNSNQQLDAEKSEPEFNGREMIVNVIVEEARREGPLRDTLKSMKNG